MPLLSSHGDYYYYYFYLAIITRKSFIEAKKEFLTSFMISMKKQNVISFFSTLTIKFSMVENFKFAKVFKNLNIN